MSMFLVIKLVHGFNFVTVCRGIFNQGYLCQKCGLGAHKECLGRLGACGRAGEIEHTHGCDVLLQNQKLLAPLVKMCTKAIK